LTATAGDPGRVAAVTRVAARVLMLDDIDPTTDLIAAGLIDSLTLVELLFALEQELDVVLSLEDLDEDSFRTIEGLAAFVAAAGERAA
jgi:acyl carrier protein